MERTLLAAQRFAPRSATDARWIYPAIVLLAAQYAAAISVSISVGFTERPVVDSYMLIAFVLSVLGGVGLLLRKLVSLWRLGEERPLARLMAGADIPAITAYFIGFQLVALQIGALTWLKEMLPLAAPYWADPMLAHLDRVVLGRDAWKLVPDFLVPPLDIVYPLWAPVKFFALVLMLSLPASPAKTRAIFAYFLTVGVLGVGGQYALSSGGPVFYDRLTGTKDFAALSARVSELTPVVKAASDYLWQGYVIRDTAIGNGISAMPSMHVATTTWAALALSAFWPRSRYVMWAFWAMILIGSIGLGWHYLSDGIVAAGGALLCWKAAERL